MRQVRPQRQACGRRGSQVLSVGQRRDRDQFALIEASQAASTMSVTSITIDAGNLST
jgi:hypothetical protein